MSYITSRLNAAPRELNQGGTGTSLIPFTTDGTIRARTPLPSAEQLASTTGRKSIYLKVTAWGRATGGTTTNYTASLQFRDAAGTETTIEASTARALASAAHNWIVQWEGVWDATSLKLQGRGWSSVASIVDAAAAMDNIITTAGPASTAEMGFIAAGTFSSGNAGNLAYLDGLVVEALEG